MAETHATGGRQDSRDPGVFECTVCDTRRGAAAVEYDYLGYAICPACSYAHGP
jgi:hypothetical protein